MTKPPRKERAPELREFIKENDQKVYDFCSYLVDERWDLEGVVLQVFREFGDSYRSQFFKATAADSLEARIKLFQMAWERCRDVLAQVHVSLPSGRDTRQLQGIDEDLLKDWNPRFKRWDALEAQVKERLSRVDPEFRAPVILKDVLKFSDEEAARILGLRWGVYRHRLHRGRLDLKESLRGRPFSTEPKASPLVLEPSPSH